MASQRGILRGFRVSSRMSAVGLKGVTAAAAASDKSLLELLHPAAVGGERKGGAPGPETPPSSIVRLVGTTASRWAAFEGAQAPSDGALDDDYHAPRDVSPARASRCSPAALASHRAGRRAPEAGCGGL